MNSFYSAFLNIHRSGVLTALAWLVPQESAARESQSRRVLCTPYNHAPCHFMQSHIRKVYACLAVTCHLRFWQNDRGLLRAAAVTPWLQGGLSGHVNSAFFPWLQDGLSGHVNSAFFPWLQGGLSGQVNLLSNGVQGGLSGQVNLLSNGVQGGLSGQVNLLSNGVQGGLSGQVNLLSNGVQGGLSGQVNLLSNRFQGGLFG